MNQIRRFPHGTSLASLLIALSLSGLVLASCSPNDPHPTPIASPTTVPPTLEPGQVTVGSLLDRIDRSWSQIRNVRSDFTSTVTNNAAGPTPAASRQTHIVTEEVKPDQRRVVTTDSSGTTEEIRVGNQIYMRGPYVTAMVAPNVGPTIWVTVNPAVVPPDSPVGQRISFLTSPIDPPYQTVSGQMKQRAATPAGQVRAGGRACTAWTFADVTPNGGKIDYTLAIDGRDMICSLTETAGTVENVTVFTFNVPDLRITPPEVATPVAATPEG